MGLRGLGWALAGAAMVMLGAGAGDMAVSKSGKELLSLIVHHRQGWGELGDGVAAHAPGTKPLAMQIKDKSYKSGLGTHAPAETVFLLDGQYRSFEADAGVQWQGGQGGSVVMQVFVDDRKVFDSGVLKETTPAVPVNT